MIRNYLKYVALACFCCIASTPTFSQSDSELVAEVLVWQEQLNTEYAGEHSPLDSSNLLTFESLPFFPIDLTYRVEAKLEYVNGVPFKMPTSTERTPLYVQYALAHFTINDTAYALPVYQNIGLMKNPDYSDYLFIPFTDYSNGNTTYGGGRYLDARIPDGNVLIIDFNKAYNPYCAYSNRFSCPIPPSESALETFIKAGVKHADDAIQHH